MSTPTIRPAHSGEESELRRIWSQAYEGDEAGASAFFHTCYRPDRAVVAQVDGLPRSAVYQVGPFRLLGTQGRPCSMTYLYALGTLPAFRGQGLGGRVIWQAGAEAVIHGSDFSCLYPASAGLRDWYAACMGTQDFFFSRVGEVRPSCPPPQGRVEPITPEAYAAARDALLSGLPYAAPPQTALLFLDACCRKYGGGLFRVCAGDRWGVCALDLDQGHLHVRELLAPQGDPAAFGALLLSVFHAECATLRTPAFWHPEFGEQVPDCVLVPCGSPRPVSQQPPYFGPLLD